MNTIDWDKIKIALNEDIKLEDKMLIMPMSFADTFYSKLKSEAMKGAIPIEWIENKLNCCDNINAEIFVKSLIRNWRKENGRSE